MLQIHLVLLSKNIVLVRESFMKLQTSKKFYVHTFSILVINCVRILSRLLPYIFEDPDWRSFFWSSLPSSSKQQFKDDGENPESHTEESVPLAQSLLNALCDLLFCPDFTVYSSKKFGPVS